MQLTENLSNRTDATYTPAKSFSQSIRETHKQIKSLLDANPDLVNPFNKIRKLARNLRTAAVYDITSKCNLWCEGCYYFEGDQHPLKEETVLEKWEAFFASERQRGVTYGYFAGAEPSLFQDRLLAACQYIPSGVVAHNGTIKIDPAIPYRITVSVWGDEVTTKRLRGGNVFWKAIRNYEGDSRALFAYTITNKNIDKIRAVAEICQDHDIELSFNMFSPTISYLQKLRSSQKNDKEFFRISSPKDNLCYTPQELEYCRITVAKLIDEFPETIVYPHPYNNEITAEGSIFTLDDNDGLATNCAGRHNGTHRTYLSTLELSDRKCCTPNVSCRECRQLTTYLPSRLQPTGKDVRHRESFIDWLEICEYWAWFYLGKQHKPVIRQQMHEITS